MRAILVDMDAINIFTVDISAKMRTFVYDKAFLSGFICKIGESRPIQARAYDEIVVMWIFCLNCSSHLNFG